MSISTRKGIAVTSFPDVCKTPAPGAGGPVPIPYPNAAQPAPGAAGKIVIPGKRAGPTPASHFSRATGSEAGTRAHGGGMISSRAGPAGAAGGVGEETQLRSQINRIHAQLGALAGGDPNRWHALVDEYVVKVSELYKARTRT